MLQTCGAVAEGCFSDIEEIVGYEGEILKRVRERHAQEKAANMSIGEIEKEIGSKFPAEIASLKLNFAAAKTLPAENHRQGSFCYTPVLLPRWGIQRYFTHRKYYR